MAANEVIPPLPPGFRVDEIPPTPAGFKLDSPTTESKPLPANAGVGNFAASLLGLPVDAVTNALNLGIAGVGRLTGTTPGLIEAPVGSAEWIKQKLRSTGLPGLSPDNPNPQSKMDTFAYDMVSRGGMIPGAAIPAVGSIIGEKIAGPHGAIIGQMTPSAATMAFNAARAPGLAQAQAQNQVRDATLRPAQDAGYVLPPSAIKPTFAGNVVESFAGKAALGQEAAIKNQQVTNQLVREELRLPPNAPITEQTLNQAREAAAAPYRQLAALSPQTAAMIDRLRDVRSEATAQWRHWDMQGVPDAQRQARALDRQAAAMERNLELRADVAGRPELVRQMRESRTYIAKTYDVERALNVGNGNVDAHIIGRAIDRGRPLTGNLEIIGRFDRAYQPFTREATNVGNPGVSALNWPAAAGLGAGGVSQFGPEGAALAAVPFVRGGVRQGMLSDIFQQNFNRPDYTPNMQPQGQLQMLMQQYLIDQQRAK